MNIYLDLKNFDFENLNLSDYLKSIIENFPKSEIFLDDVSDVNSDHIRKYHLKTYKNNCEVLIYFKKIIQIQH